LDSSLFGLFTQAYLGIALLPRIEFLLKAKYGYFMMRITVATTKVFKIASGTPIK